MFIHEKAVVETEDVGEGTRVWAFAHILPGARIGRDCNICDGVFIENDVLVGDRVTVKCGVQLWDGIRLENDVFVGPNATFASDRFPRSNVPPGTWKQTVVSDGASIGANATILPGITIGRDAMVSAGAVVTRDVPPHAIVVGNPAYITGYANTQLKPFDRKLATGGAGDGQPYAIGGAALHCLSVHADMRGRLVVGEEGGTGLPFEPKRYYLVMDIPSREVRGEHAHRTQEQFLVCVRGECSVIVDDSRTRSEVVLDDPALGLHIPPMVWAAQYKFSGDAVLLVLTSDKYDPEDYIRSYDEYLATIAKGLAP